MKESGLLDQLGQIGSVWATEIKIMIRPINPWSIIWISPFKPLTLKYTLLICFALTFQVVEATETVNSPTAWVIGGRTITFHPGPHLTDSWVRCASYYSISPSQKSDETMYVTSLIDKHDFRVIKPEIYVSSTGNTVLIHEDVSDGSPCFQYILIYYDNRFNSDQIRHIEFVKRNGYPDSIEIKNITDEKVNFIKHTNVINAALDKPKRESKKFTDIEDSPPYN